MSTQILRIRIPMCYSPNVQLDPAQGSPASSLTRVRRLLGQWRFTVDKERKMVTLDFGEPWGSITVPAELVLSFLSNQQLKDEVRDVITCGLEPDSNGTEDRADVEALRKTWQQDYKDRQVAHQLDQLLDTVGY